MHDLDRQQARLDRAHAGLDTCRCGRMAVYGNLCEDCWVDTLHDTKTAEAEARSQAKGIIRLGPQDDLILLVRDGAVSCFPAAGR